MTMTDEELRIVEAAADVDDDSRAEFIRAAALREARAVLARKSADREHRNRDDFDYILDDPEIRQHLRMALEASRRRRRLD